MGTLADRKRRARFETLGAVRDKGRTRPLVIELHPTYLTIGLKGCRGTSAHTISFEGIYWSAAKLAAERKRLEKLAARKNKKAK